MEVKGGLDCEFIENPPKSVQSECPVCLLVLREPYQATCCGYSFCRVCIDRIKTANSGCPCCNNPEFTIFPNKGLQRSLNDYKVRCTQLKSGCEWVGEILELEKHLNVSPQKEEQLKGCEFVKIKCLYCSDLFLRSAVKAHQIDECPKRPSTCPHCKIVTTSHDTLVSEHFLSCNLFPVACPNKCGKTFRRENISSHRLRFCPLEMVDCDFKHVGCMERRNRRDKAEHLEKSVTSHLLLQTNSYKKLLKENEQLKRQVQEMSKDLEAVMVFTGFKREEQSQPVEPVQPESTFSKKRFLMDQFTQHNLAGDLWYSPPFYSHPFGYKLCLRVRANGEGKGKGTHVSMYVNLMQGENDESLKWPFSAKITVKLLNRENDKHAVHTINFTPQSATADTTHRVIDRTRALKGRGHQRIVPHTDLSDFLKNDSLLFEVTNVELLT